jgi:hypothetical protein
MNQLPENRLPVNRLSVNRLLVNRLLVNRMLAVAGPMAATALLGAACVAWAATPASHAAWSGLAFFLSVAGVVASGLRLALAGVPRPEDTYLLSPPERAWLLLLTMLRRLPGEEIAVAAIVWLEAAYPARPWHTAALGAALVAYLLTAHLAESGAAAGRLLRGHAKLLIAGACLLALAAGAAMAPAAGPGAGSAVARVLAAAAVIAAAAMVLPA